VRSASNVSNEKRPRATRRATPPGTGGRPALPGVGEGVTGRAGVFVAGTVAAGPAAGVDESRRNAHVPPSVAAAAAPAPMASRARLDNALAMATGYSPWSQCSLRECPRDGIWRNGGAAIDGKVRGVPGPLGARRAARCCWRENSPD
jgi:hypothetical protein